MRVWIQVATLFFTLQAFSTSHASWASFPPPNLTCLDENHESLPYLNDQVMEWKTSTPDQTLKRAMIHGTVTQIFSKKTGHTHFAINIDQDPSGDIEVIYNDNFGELPKIQLGMKVVACGDYITVGPKARLPSPMGAIIHWLHHNPGDRDGGRHKHGFLVINGRTYGSPAQN